MNKLLCSAALLAWLVPAAHAREWTDDTGARHAEAEFVSVDGDLVRFRVASGELRGCELQGLSRSDQEFINAMQRRGSPNTQQLTSAVRSNPPSNCQSIECTVMVPETVVENRVCNVVEYRAEQRQCRYTHYRPVLDKKTVQYERLVPKYETRSRTVTFTVCKPVITTQQRQCTVMVPHAETRQGTRTVCRMVPVEQKRTVCEDQGSWQQVVQKYQGPCGECERTCNVWVPKIVSREVAYTVMKPQTEQVPYQYTVSICRPETRTQNVQICNLVPEKQTRTEQYTMCVLERRTETREVTTCRLDPEEVVSTYTVQVPYTVQRTVPVQVCRMVPKTVKYQVPACTQSCNPCRRCW